MKTIPVEEVAQFKGEIIDIFEDFLEEHHATLENDERNEALEDADDPSEVAIIYGSHYDVIGDVIEYDVLPKLTDDTMTTSDAADKIIDAFFNLFKENSDDTMFLLSMKTSVGTFRTDIIRTLDAWMK